MPSGTAHDPSTSSGTVVALEGTFPVDDAPARSTDCVGWGPHNVLQVCSRWFVSFYLASLLSPDCQRGVRDHPLTHRRIEADSLEVIVGAKWSHALLPEVFYPATARLCVQTTSNLIVYRVSRHGTGRVHASHGIGLVCCGSGYQAPPNERGASSQGSAPPPAPMEGDSSAAPPLAPGGAAGGAAPAKSGKKAPPKASKAKTAATTRKRRRRACSDSSTSSDDSSSASSTGTSDADDEERVASRSRRATQGARRATSSPRASAAKPRKGDAPAPKKTRAAPSPSREATGQQSSGRNSESGPTAEQLATQDGDVALIDYHWLDQDELAVVTTKGLHLVSMLGDTSDEDAPATRHLLPPLHRWGSPEEDAALGFRAPAPVCAAALFTDGLCLTAPAPALAHLRRVILVASPFFLRVLHVTRGTPPAVRLLQVVEMPQLQSVPASLCVVALPSPTPHPTENSMRASGSGGGGEEPGADIVAFVAVPGAVLRCRFRLTSAAPAIPRARCHAETVQVEACYSLEAAVGEVCLRRLMPVPFVTGRVTAHGSAEAGDAAEAGSGSRSVAVAVLGVCERTVLGFTPDGPSLSLFLQCPLVLGCSDMPAHRCAGVCGVAVHASGTLALAAVQTGQAAHEPLHLWPVCADTPDGWLARLAALGGLVLEPARQLQSERARSRAGDGAAAQRGRGLLCSMLQRQTSTSFFVHEQLFAGAAAPVTLELHRYWHARERAHAPPSPEALEELRRLAASDGLGACARMVPATDVLLRRRYLELRAEYATSLFLRSPPPGAGSLLPGTTGDDDADAGVSASLLLAPAALASLVVGWPWWRLLRHLRLTCPWDRPVVSELVVANAVLVLAKRYSYAKTAPQASETLRDSAASTSTPANGRVVGAHEGLSTTAEAVVSCATRADALDVDGAIAFVEAYVRAQRAALRLETSSTAASAHWCVSESWVSSLQAFLNATAYRHRSGAEPASDTAAPHLFPCSLCDREGSVQLRLGLASTSTHVPPPSPGTATPASAAPARHTTLFSGATLSPLSFFSEECVLTRCLACGLGDFADGPLCRVCGGLLM